MILGLDHVQLAIPPGGEEEARAFYGGVLGLSELPKPPRLRGRGGVWFGGSVALHLGAEPSFRPARKAHPAFRASNLDDLAERLRAVGHPVRPDDSLPGRSRFYTADPFGNRLEFLGPVHSDSAAGAVE